MIYLKNDYSEGALPEVLQALIDTNSDHTAGYGDDPYCERAAQLLRQQFACPGADVHFLVGGTQTNTTCITAFLRPWEAVIAAETAHIAVHETGAIEARGHKVCIVPTTDGKLTSADVERVFREHQTWNTEHMVYPKLVYISNPTELGTIYTCAELQALRSVCDALGLYLYLDGARLACALTCEENNLRPADLPHLCDAFYVGGTKNGLLFGEALVILREELKPHFRAMIKQCGGLLAKGRLLGVQFGTFFQNDLWLNAAVHANTMAKRLQEGIAEKGYAFYVTSPTNQVFPIFPRALASRLERDFVFDYQALLDGDRAALRLVTSWATPVSAVEAFLSAI